MDLQCLRNFSNFLITTEVEMAIWEPCNYVSNLAYDRLLVEMCVQQVREGVNEKKNVFFRALPELPKPPPHDPNSGNLVLFFRKSKFKI